MADVDIDPFGKHTSKPDEPTSEDIPLIPGKGGVPTWEPEREQETSLEGARTIILNDYIKDLFKKLSGRIVVTPQKFNSLHFEIEDGELRYTGVPKPPNKRREAITG